jgi:hypothetical protein
MGYLIIQPLTQVKEEVVAVEVTQEADLVTTPAVEAEEEVNHFLYCCYK